MKKIDLTHTFPWTSGPRSESSGPELGGGRKEGEKKKTQSLLAGCWRPPGRRSRSRSRRGDSLFRKISLLLLLGGGEEKLRKEEEEEGGGASLSSSPSATRVGPRQCSPSAAGPARGGRRRPEMRCRRASGRGGRAARQRRPSWPRRHWHWQSGGGERFCACCWGRAGLLSTLACPLLLLLPERRPWGAGDRWGWWGGARRNLRGFLSIGASLGEKSRDAHLCVL